jgi:NTP pyrophosphatase (non-canonical NTP hydrolase)
MASELTGHINLTSFFAVNRQRCHQWMGEKDTLLHHLVGLAGEVGEVCNAAKKSDRQGKAGGEPVDSGEVAAELADVMIYLDLVAMHFGVDLGAAVVEKFNPTSIKYGFPQRLGPAAPPASEPKPEEFNVGDSVRIDCERSTHHDDRGEVCGHRDNNRFSVQVRLGGNAGEVWFAPSELRHEPPAAEKPVAYWWCANCACELSGTRVTNDEHCDTCGHPVYVVELDDPTDLLRKRAEKAASDLATEKARVKELEADKEQRINAHSASEEASEHRITTLETVLEQAAKALQSVWAVGTVKAVGLLEVGAVAEEVAEQMKDVEAERDAMRKDLAIAATDLYVTLPLPGSEMARVLNAAIILRRERDALKRQAARLHEQFPENTERRLREAHVAIGRVLALFSVPEPEKDAF